MSHTTRRRGAVVPLLAVPTALLVVYGALFVWNLHTTDDTTEQAQAELREELQDQSVPTAASGRFPGPVTGVAGDDAADRSEPSRPRAVQVNDDPRMGGSSTSSPSPELGVGAPLGELWFERDGERFLSEPSVFVHGTEAQQLAVGPGHYPSTPLPGQPGNAGIAGHRTTYGAPFGDLDQLRRGDVIVVRMDSEVHRFRVERSAVVDPEDVWVLDRDPLDTGNPTLTLTTCHPRYSARERLIVWADAVST